VKLLTLIRYAVRRNSAGYFNMDIPRVASKISLIIHLQYQYLMPVLSYTSLSVIGLQGMKMSIEDLSLEHGVWSIMYHLPLIWVGLHH
jgi:hypothetical protein